MWNWKTKFVNLKDGVKFMWRSIIFRKTGKNSAETDSEMHKGTHWSPNVKVKVRDPLRELKNPSDSENVD